MQYLLALVYIFFTTSGITFLKMGGDSLKLSIKDGIDFSIGWKTMIGFLLYLVSFLLWQRLLAKYDLSVMVPIVTGIVQIIIIIIGHLIFKESINLTSVIGAMLIIIGIVVLTLGNRG